MAKLIEGILGGFSGRVGSVVGYHRRGRWFVRAYQPNIRDRKSEAQLAQRGRFKSMIQFASPATPVLRVGLRRYAWKQVITEGNAFLRLNHGWFAADASVDYARLRFSRGSLVGLRLTEAAVDEGGALKVKWQCLGGQPGDRIHIFIYSEVQRQGVCAEADRAAGHVAVLLPDGMAADSGGLHVWAFAAGAQGEVSPTAYISTSNRLETTVLHDDALCVNDPDYSSTKAEAADIRQEKAHGIGHIPWG